MSGLSHMLGQEGFPDSFHEDGAWWLPSGGEVFSRQLRLGWFRSPNIGTCEKPRLFAFFIVSFIFASFVTLLFSDL